MATVQYAGQFAKSFGYFHRWHGKPTMKIIKPVSTWTLAAGIEYDPHQDQFIQGDGEVAGVTYIAQPSITVNYLPSRQNNAMTIGIPGLTTVTATEQPIILQWTAIVQAAIATCWGVLIGDTLYRVKSWELFPLVSPVEIRVSLIEAVRP